MKKQFCNILLLAAGLIVSSDAAFAAAPRAMSITDELLALLLEKHLPAPLYEQGSNPWPGGAYSLEVHKAGRPEVTSSTKNIHVKIPLKVLIAGNAGSELLQLKMTCSSTFTTIGEITFTPEKPGVVSSLASAITLPVPPAMANCDGMQFPIEEYLRNVVTQNKRQWELKLDAQMKEWLQGEGVKPAQTPAPAPAAAAK
ncbi:MAG: hypothetical protein NVV73_02060 [Cellvibrionaceae bacterium]|nr:hypothetical protein [Cellvibrionaceae bacterium]